MRLSAWHSLRLNGALDRVKISRIIRNRPRTPINLPTQARKATCISAWKRRSRGIKSQLFFLPVASQLHSALLEPTRRQRNALLWSERGWRQCMINSNSTRNRNANIVASIADEEDVPQWDSYDLGSNLTLGNHTDFEQLKCHLDHLDALVIHLSPGSLPDRSNQRARFYWICRPTFRDAVQLMTGFCAGRRRKSAHWQSSHASPSGMASSTALKVNSEDISVCFFFLFGGRRRQKARIR